MMKHLFLLLTSICLLTACYGKQAQTDNQADCEEADSAAVTYYMLRANGKYAEYVSAMHSCDSMPDAYRNNMALMLEQHQAEVMKRKKGVKRANVIRCELHNNAHMANVFLNVTFNDGSQEEVIMPMILDGKQWRIQ